MDCWWAGVTLSPNRIDDEAPNIHHALPGNGGQWRHDGLGTSENFGKFSKRAACQLGGWLPTTEAEISGLQCFMDHARRGYRILLNSHSCPEFKLTHPGQTSPVDILRQT